MEDLGHKASFQLLDEPLSPRKLIHKSFETFINTIFRVAYSEAPISVCRDYQIYRWMVKRC